MNWIDIKERLPNKLQKVLFHWVCLGGNKNVSMGYLCNEGWDIYLPYHSFKMCPEKLKVTHWMELPDYPSDTICTHENINMESKHQYEDCKKETPKLVREIEAL